MSWPFKVFMCGLLALLLWGLLLEVVLYGAYEELRDAWYHRSQKYRFSRLLREHALTAIAVVLTVVK